MVSGKHKEHLKKLSGLKEVIYKKLYEDNYPQVMRLCLGYTTGNEALAKDLAQETFLKIWQHLDSFRNESAIATWVYRITINTCLAAIKKEKKRHYIENVNDVQIPTDTDEHIDKEHMFKQLYTCVNKLTATNKAIILLELEGLSQQEIASIMELKHEALRTRIHRIKNQLIKCVNHE
ncbi:RNA polymerase sigma factor [Maribacter sp. X9]|uniref:RNA polymerase sigma factor n=1 Tax=Maribacter sp. X9 TaxID=3402159 RepID=UPI003AF39B9E